MQKENINQTWFHYAKGAVWKVVLAAVLVFLTERFIWKGLAHPSSHHAKPIFQALSVLFAIVFTIVAILLIYLAIRDCRDTYEAVRGRPTVVKPPSTSAAEDRPTTVSDQV